MGHIFLFIYPTPSHACLLPSTYMKFQTPRGKPVFRINILFTQTVEAHTYQSWAWLSRNPSSQMPAKVAQYNRPTCILVVSGLLLPFSPQLTQESKLHEGQDLCAVMHLLEQCVTDKCATIFIE